MKTRDLIAPGFVIIAVTAGAWFWSSPAGIAHAPPVTFSYLDGQQVALKELRGKPVLVTFWATTCPGCIKEMPHLMALYDDLSSRGFELIGVAMSYDPPNHVLELVQKRNVPYPVSLDVNGAIARSFGDVMLTPTSFLIAPDGRIVKQKVGELNIGALRRQILDLLPGRQETVTDNRQNAAADTTRLVAN